MSRLIDADALRKELRKNLCPIKGSDVYFVRQLIDNAPTVELTEEQAIDKLHETGWMQNHDREMTEQPTGEWVYLFTFLDSKIYECNNCKGRLSLDIPQRIEDFKYCSGCGAKMKGGEDNGTTD